MLARFQVDASESVLDAIPTGRTLGRIVTAGTGSGKTLAFYLPALVDIVQAAVPVVQQFSAWAGENPALAAC